MKKSKLARGLLMGLKEAVASKKTNRLECNRKLVRKLLNIVEEYPDLRFSQILQNFDFVTPVEVTEVGRGGRETTSLVWRDEFYLESNELVKRVYKEKE